MSTTKQGELFAASRAHIPTHSPAPAPTPPEPSPWQCRQDGCSSRSRRLVRCAGPKDAIINVYACRGCDHITSHLVDEISP